MSQPEVQSALGNPSGVQLAYDSTDKCSKNDLVWITEIHTGFLKIFHLQSTPVRIQSRRSLEGPDPSVRDKLRKRQARPSLAADSVKCQIQMKEYEKIP